MSADYLREQPLSTEQDMPPGHHSLNHSWCSADAPNGSYTKSEEAAGAHRAGAAVSQDTASAATGGALDASECSIGREDARGQETGEVRGGVDVPLLKLGPLAAAVGKPRKACMLKPLPRYGGGPEVASDDASARVAVRGSTQPSHVRAGAEGGERGESEGEALSAGEPAAAAATVHLVGDAGGDAATAPAPFEPLPRVCSQPTRTACDPSTFLPALPPPC